MKAALGELSDRLGGTLFDADPETEVDSWALDSRQAKPGSVFLAIRGNRVDGHDFAPDVFRAGAAAAVVERTVDGPRIQVSNLANALAKMAKSWRQEFHGPVIGVTGSAGKTTTKEFIAAALGTLGPVLKNQGNQNTEFTSPLVWSELNQSHRAAVIEMAMRGAGQIAHLASFSEPTIGVVTNIGHSHVEMVGSRDGIARAKSELLTALPADGTAVLWAEDEYRYLLASKFGGKKVTFGLSDQADCRVLDYRLDGQEACVVKGNCMGAEWSCRIPSLGRQNALAASAAVLTAHLAGVKPSDAAQALESVDLPPMRMEIRRFNGVTILLDAYNASPQSMEMALQTLDDLASPEHRHVLLAAMRELGSYEESAHRELGKSLPGHQIASAFLVGEPMRFTGEEASPGISKLQMSNSLDEAASYLRSLKPGDTVLVKGSRAYELEKAVEALQT